MTEPKWAGRAWLPALPIRKIRISEHSVVQRVFPEMSCQIAVVDSDVRGHDIVQTDLRPPYDRLLLRRSGARRVESNLPVVVATQGGDPADWTDPPTFAWDTLGQLETHGATPDGVRESWRGLFAFREAGPDAPGLRPPQVGALHAISAHFAIGKQFDAATVVLPTGTGKTETMLATLVYRRLDPIIVRYADGTYSYNCYHIAPNLTGALFDKGRLEAWDWTGIPLNQESITFAGNTDTIQYRTYERIAEEFDVIFNDDGPGEAADLVCFKDVDEKTIRLCLVHCKGAHGGRVSQDIRNFYVVCGQAQKNITARHMGMSKLARELQRRHEAWVARGASRFLKGGMPELAYFKEKARRSKLEFEAILVQPGASAVTITDDSLRLLATPSSI